MHWVKAGWKQHKNATSYFELFLDATPYETPAVGPLSPISKTIQERRRRAEPCWWSKDEFISDIFQWTPTHERGSIDRPARTYLHQLCADTGCRLEDLDDRDGWGERERERERERQSWQSMLSARFDDDDDDDEIKIVTWNCDCLQNKLKRKRTCLALNSPEGFDTP